MPCARTKTYKAMVKEYGSKKGKRVYFAYRKKHKR